MKIYNYTLCYNAEDGKFHIGYNCGEEKEAFFGNITNEIANVSGYIGEGKILRFKDFSFTTSADICLALPDGITIIFEGENNLRVTNDNPKANVAVLYSSGSLTLKGGTNDSLNIHADTKQGLWSRAVCARGGDLTVNGGKITALGGKANKSCGLYAGGRLWIDIGERGWIKLLNGHITVLAGANAVRAAEGKLLIAAGSEVNNVKEYAGNTQFNGDCLSPVDMTKPVTLVFGNNT